MGMDILKQLILVINASLIMWFLVEKINNDNEKILSRNKILFFISYIILVFINLRYLSEFRLLGNYGTLILLNYIYYRKRFINSFINSSVIFFTYMMGDIIAGILLMYLIKSSIITIQTNFAMSIIVNQMILAIVYFITYLIKPLLIKINDIRMDKKNSLLVIFNILLLSILVYLSILGYGYINEYAQNINTKYLDIIIIGIMVALFSFMIYLLYIINKYIINNNKYEELIEISKIDKMTGTLNRESGLSTLKNLIEESKKKGKELTICYIDINDLKYVNDNFGHVQGDILIKNISGVIKDNLRKTDFITRLGGDEFLIIFKDCKVNEVGSILKRIVNLLEEASETSKYNMSISYGFYQIEPSINISLKRILEMADEEMYKYKRKLKSELLEI